MEQQGEYHEALGRSGSPVRQTSGGSSPGVGHAQRAAPAAQSVPCHPPASGADGRIDGYLASGSRLERRADSSILGAAAAPLTQLSSPHDRLHASSGPPPTVRPGSAVTVPPTVNEHADATTAAEISALIPQLQLQNPSSYCYSRACLLAYLWLIIQSPSSFQVLGLEPLKGFLKQARCSKSLVPPAMVASTLPTARRCGFPPASASGPKCTLPARSLAIL